MRAAETLNGGQAPNLLSQVCGLQKKISPMWAKPREFSGSTIAAALQYLLQIPVLQSVLQVRSLDANIKLPPDLTLVVRRRHPSTIVPKFQVSTAAATRRTQDNAAARHAEWQHNTWRSSQQAASRSTPALYPR